MKPNLLKQRLAEEKVPVGHMIFEFGTRGMPRLLETTGIDFAIIDSEHSGFAVSELADMMAWFKATPVTPIVRIPPADDHFVARCLDLGAMGIMAPNVQTAAEARRLVEAAKYPPMGSRGAGFGTALTDFKPVEPKTFMEESNRNTAIICQIESRQGLENLDEIAAVPGLDVLWVGHFDLTVSMGIAAQFQHEEFLDALRLVVETARRHGLGAGIQPREQEQARQWMEMGFSVISCGGDVMVYGEALTQRVAGVRRLAGGQ